MGTSPSLPLLMRFRFIDRNFRFKEKLYQRSEKIKEFFRWVDLYIYTLIMKHFIQAQKWHVPFYKDPLKPPLNSLWIKGRNIENAGRD
jgi:hypothetical protein